MAEKRCAVCDGNLWTRARVWMRCVWCDAEAPPDDDAIVVPTDWLIDVVPALVSLAGAERSISRMVNATTRRHVREYGRAYVGAPISEGEIDTIAFAFLMRRTMAALLRSKRRGLDAPPGLDYSQCEDDDTCPPTHDPN